MKGDFAQTDHGNGGPNEVPRLHGTHFAVHCIEEDDSDELVNDQETEGTSNWNLFSLLVDIDFGFG